MLYNRIDLFATPYAHFSSLYSIEYCEVSSPLEARGQAHRVLSASHCRLRQIRTACPAARPTLAASSRAEQATVKSLRVESIPSGSVLSTYDLIPSNK